MSQIALLMIVSIILYRSYRLLAFSRFDESLVSAFSALIYIVCLWGAAHMQANGLTISKIDVAGFAWPPTKDEISDLSMYWTVELIVILFAECSVMKFTRPAFQRKSNIFQYQGNNGEFSQKRIELAVIILFGIGILANGVFSDPGIESRGIGGNGIQILLKNFLTVGLSLLCFHRLFRKPIFFAILVGGTIFLVASHVRSPLILVVFGYVSGLIARNQLTPKLAIRLMFFATLLAFTSAVMSSVRGAIIRGNDVEVASIISDSASNPFVSIYESGLDTLDGYRLSMAIAPSEPAKPFDVLTAFTTFVPRAVWPDKPSDLSIFVSQYYLHYEAGGQFLSPMGYLTLSFGGYAFGLLALMVFVALMSLIVTKFRQTFISAIAICITFRFMLGGGAFDIYYGLTILLSYSVALLISQTVSGSSFERTKLAS